MAVLQQVGALFLPNPGTGASAARHLRNAGVYAVLAAVSVLGLLLGAAGALVVSLVRDGSPVDGPVLLAAAVIAVVAVIAPAPSFRTHSAAVARDIFRNPGGRVPHNRADMTFFSAATTGVLLAAVWVPFSVVFTFLLAGIVVLVAAATRARRGDPAAGQDVLLDSVEFVAGTLTGYLIVAVTVPFDVDANRLVSPWPFLVGSVAADAAALATLAVWAAVTGTVRSTNSLRTLLDLRRMATAVVPGGIALACVLAAEQAEDTVQGVTYLLVVFTGAWAALWLASLTRWRMEAEDAVVAWQAQTAKESADLTAGSVSGLLVQEAAAQAAIRLALVAFVNERCMMVVRGSLAAGGRGRFYAVSSDPDDDPRVEMLTPAREREFAAAVDDHPHAVHLQVMLGSTVAAELVTFDSRVFGAQWARGARVRDMFTRALTTALVSPFLAQQSTASPDRVFTDMFDPLTRQPNLTALRAAFDALSTSAGRDGRASNLTVTAVEVHGFSDYVASFGPFDPDGRTLASALLRRIGSDPVLAGSDAFVAYEHPGRAWILLGGQVNVTAAQHTVKMLMESLTSEPLPAGGLDAHAPLLTESRVYRLHGLTFEELRAAVLDGLAARRTQFASLVPGPASGTGSGSGVDLDEPGDDPVSADLVAEFLRDRADGRFTCRFSPVSSVADDPAYPYRVAGAEAVPLWRHRSLGSLTGGALMALLEREPVLARLVVATLLTDAAVAAGQVRTTNPDLPGFTVAVRVPVSLLAGPGDGEDDLPALLASASGAARVGPDAVTLRVAAVPPGAHPGLAALAQVGVRVSVDLDGFDTLPPGPDGDAVGQVLLSPAQTAAVVDGTSALLATLKTAAWFARGLTVLGVTDSAQVAAGMRPDLFTLAQNVAASPLTVAELNARLARLRLGAPSA